VAQAGAPKKIQGNDTLSMAGKSKKGDKVWQDKARKMRLNLVASLRANEKSL